MTAHPGKPGCRSISESSGGSRVHLLLLPNESCHLLKTLSAYCDMWTWSSLLSGTTNPLIGYSLSQNGHLT